MKGDVRVAPNGGVVIHKGLSTKAWFRAFSTGTVVGGAKRKKAKVARAAGGWSGAG